MEGPAPKLDAYGTQPECRQINVGRLFHMFHSLEASSRRPNNDG